MNDMLERPEAQPDVEVFTRVSTQVKTMGEAWSFVMARIDSVGPDPSVRIEPFWSCIVTEDADGEEVHETTRMFEVVVAGAVPENPEMAAQHTL